MRRFNTCLVLVALVAAGCSSTPEVADEAATVALADAGTPATASSSAAVVPDKVVDANELVAHTPAKPICRELLLWGSNVHETRCMSAENWKIWDAAEARRATETLRSMQSGTYR